MDQDLISRWLNAGPMVWGWSDCATMCANELWRATGKDPVARWRDIDGYVRHSWHAELPSGTDIASPRRMLKAMQVLGFKPAQTLGAEPLTVGVALVPDLAYCLCLGKGWWIVRGDPGATVITEDVVRRAWTWPTES